MYTYVQYQTFNCLFSSKNIKKNMQGQSIIKWLGGGKWRIISQDELALFRVMISRFFPCATVWRIYAAKLTPEILILSQKFRISLVFVLCQGIPEFWKNVSFFSVKPPFKIAACRIGFTWSEPWKTDKFLNILFSVTLWNLAVLAQVGERECALPKLCNSKYSFSIMPALPWMTAGKTADWKRVFGVPRISSYRSMVGSRRSETGVVTKPVFCCTGSGRRGDACRWTYARYAKTAAWGCWRPNRMFGGFDTSNLTGGASAFPVTTVTWATVGCGGWGGWASIERRYRLPILIELSCFNFLLSTTSQVHLYSYTLLLPSKQK